MDPSKDYADIARGIEGFLNLQPLLNSIQGVLNDYFPAAYLIAFVLLVVGTMREFLFPETRRFMQNLLRAVLLVATISFLPSFMNWCDQGNYRRNTQNCQRNCSFFHRFPLISTLVDGFFDLKGIRQNERAWRLFSCK